MTENTANQTEITGSVYDDAFYENQVSESLRSAQIVLKTLFEYLQPKSVVDVGCGRGPWLTAAGELGATTLKGYDGPWVDKKELLSDAIDFSEIDFEKNLELEGNYDLGISVEVAEHISESNSENFLRRLCGFSQTILFSAA
ncbi:MAG: hypothetical protein KC931_22040, partial [Candidatus Omnitrophica bacterium]|nr:hypothetical protein [Candidatus Omnitrophota bacterium]